MPPGLPQPPTARPIDPDVPAPLHPAHHGWIHPDLRFAQTSLPAPAACLLQTLGLLAAAYAVVPVAQICQSLGTWWPAAVWSLMLALLLRSSLPRSARGTALTALLLGLLSLPYAAGWTIDWAASMQDPADSSIHLLAMVAIGHACAGLACLLVHRAGGGMWSGLGVRRWAWSTDLPQSALAVGVCYLAMLASLFILAASLGLWYLLDPSGPARAMDSMAEQRLGAIGQFVGPGLLEMALLMSLVAFGEELLFRSILLGRLARLTGRWWLTVGLAASVFAVGHGYQGSFAIVQTGLLALALSILYLRTARVWPLVVAHALFNVINLSAASLALDTLGPAEPT